MSKLLGFFAIAIVIYVIATGVFNTISSLWISLTQFLFHNTLGIIALICGICAIIFAFISYKLPPKIRESKERIKAFTPTLKLVSNLKAIPNKQNNKTYLNMDQEIQKQVIDLGSLSLEGFFREVATTLNKPSPVIFKGWGNRRFELDVERVYIMSNYIQAVRGACNSFLQLQADIFFAEEKFENFVEQNKVRAEGDLDLIKEQYKDRKWNMEYERRMKEADLKDREIAQDEKRAHIEEQKARNKFFIMAIKEFPEMPAPLKAYMFTQVHGRYPEAKRDFEIEDKISDYIIKKYDNDLEDMDLDIKKKKEEVETQIEKLKHEREKKYK